MSRPSMRDQIAAKRAEAAKTPARRAQDVQAASAAASARGYGQTEQPLADKTVSGQVKKASKSGKLDIASLSLHRVPPEVYSVLLGISPKNLERPPSPSGDDQTIGGLSGSFEKLETSSRKEVFGKDTTNEDSWVECEELTVFKAGENKIDRLDSEIGAFGGLKSIDLSHNLLTSLPNSFADLLRLTSVDLSYNQLASVPPQILLLPAITALDLSHNEITGLDFTNPIEPTDEGLAYGSGFLSTSFSRAQKKTKEILPTLRVFNLGYNGLSNEAVRPLSQLKSLANVNLEANRLEGTLDLASLGLDRAQLSDLAKLDLSGNARLKDTKGNLQGVDVNTEGCGGGASDFTSSANSEETAGAAQPKRPTKPPLPSPDPTMTIVFRTCPAATFDAEPLDIDFDLYLPSTPAGSKGHPLVIWFHGGGLLQGNKENLPPHFRRLPDHPYEKNGTTEHVAVISPNYRLAPQVPILDILSDVTALMNYVRTKLNDRLKKDGRGDHLIDTDRIALSGGSAGGYLAMIGGMAVSPRTSDEATGGYRGEKGIKCIAPFYPITDLEDSFWSTKTNPVPWYGKTVPDEAARPHLDLKAAPICTAKSGGPRSILYVYMLQEALFPSLLFMRQKSVGHSLDAFRPDAHTMSITARIELAVQAQVKQPPMYFVWATADDKVQPMQKTLDSLGRYKGDVEEWKVVGADHGFDEDPGEECEGFREWLGQTLL